MPWSKEHKRATRERIVDAAAAAFRTRGVAGISVAELMEAAGLTHGGFYAHFASKDDLVAEAVGHASAQTESLLTQAAARAKPGRKLLAVAEAYLSAQHLRHPEWGCPIAALGAELARDEGPARKAFGAAVRERLAWLETQAEALSPAARRRRAAGVLAAMVGALTIARALGDTDDAESYLGEVREFLRESIAASRGGG